MSKLLGSADVGVPAADVLVVGAGPAGMFAAARLSEQLPGLRVLIIDKGKDVLSRSLTAPVTEYPGGWRTHDLVSGAGGAGLFSDGKLTLTLEAGGKLGNSLPVDTGRHYLRYIEEKLLALDGVSVTRLGEPKAVEEFGAEAAQEGLSYKHLPVRHFGSDALRQIVARFFAELESSNVSLRFNTEVVAFHPLRSGATVQVRDRQGRTSSIKAHFVIFAVGKEGSLPLVEQFRGLGVGSTPNRLYFGVRMETPPLTSSAQLSFDPKLSMLFEDGTKMKTHCFCRRGQIIPLEYFGLPLAGSHTPFTEKQGQQTNQTNAVLGILLGDTPANRVSTPQMMAMLRAVSSKTRGRLLVQRLEDFLYKRPTSWDRLRSNSIAVLPQAVAGAVHALDLPLDFNQKFHDFVRRLSSLDAAVGAPDALVYAPAIEWWMPRIETNVELETALAGIFVAGDGAGVSQGITYAATTGLVVADAIRQRLQG